MTRWHRWPFGAVRAGGLFRGRAADLTGKVVIITGASSGIGRAAAHAFAREGACVVLVARRAERLRAVADALAEMGAAAWVMPADVTCDHDLEALVEHALGACGRIDILVNNAGLAFGGGHHALEPARLRRLVDTNVYGPCASRSSSCR
ncbi:MAG: SDR family NAD(P)-dependent oxidoreductase [Anaerolineae bacterium]|nr:SDR family NAD(P)-dependent oxidoreductase [Anaerolineae bacterium]